MEFCPLSCGVMLRWAQLLSAPLQHGLRFLHHPLPADPSASLAARFPMRETYGLTTFHISNPVSDLGPTCTPEVQRSRQSNRYALVLTSYHFGPGVSHDLAVSSILRLFHVTTLAVVHMCWPYHPTLAPSPPDTGS
jgi:hypothetical protein